MTKAQENIKVLTVYQPFATLLLFEEKLFETRRMFTKHRGAYLLHSAKRMTVEGKMLCNDPVVKTALMRCGIRHFSELPTGQVLGSFRVESCPQMGTDISPEDVSELERKVGIWERGRFAWEVKDMRKLVNPIPHTGGQGIYRKFRGDVSKLVFTDGTSMEGDHLPHFQPTLFQ